MNWNRNIQDYLIVTIIAALIWLYAEGEDVVNYPAESPREVSVNLVLEGSPELIIDTPRRNVRVQFLVAASQRDQIKREIERPGGLVLRLPPGDPRVQKGKFNLDLKAELEALAKAGIKYIEPQNVEVIVDRLVQHTMPLTFPKPENVKLAPGSTPEITPPVVHLTLPEGLLERLKQSAGAEPLRIEPAVKLSELQKGAKVKTRARVILPAILAGAPGVKADVEEVELSLTILEEVAEARLSSVPVWPWMPETVLKNYNIAIHPADQLQQDVVVKGPTDIIQRIREDQSLVIAKLRLDSEFVGMDIGKERSAQISFDTPPGVTVVNGSRTVRVTISRRGE